MPTLLSTATISIISTGAINALTDSRLVIELSSRTLRPSVRCLLGSKPYTRKAFMRDSQLNPQQLAEACAEAMFSRDHASQGLGMRITRVAPASPN